MTTGGFCLCSIIVPFSNLIISLRLSSTLGASVYDAFSGDSIGLLTFSSKCTTFPYFLAFKAFLWLLSMTCLLIHLLPVPKISNASTTKLTPITKYKTPRKTYPHKYLVSGSGTKSVNRYIKYPINISMHSLNIASPFNLSVSIGCQCTI